MNQKLLTIGVVAVMIAAAIGFVAFYPGSDEGNDDTFASAEIYIESVENPGNPLVAKMDLSKPSVSESMMLSFGQSVRSAEFEPLNAFSSNIPTISEYGNYAIWSVVKVKMDATSDITSLNSVRVTFSGVPGDDPSYRTNTPSHNVAESQYHKLLSTTGLALVGQKKTSGLGFGQEITFDQSQMTTDGGKFSKHWHATNQYSGSAINNLFGTRVDGAVIEVVVDVVATDATGATVTKQLVTSMKISVGSWSASALSIAVTSFSSGQQGLQMYDSMEAIREDA